MATTIDIEKTIYELNCSLEATATYRDDALSGLSAMRVIGVITEEEQRKYAFEVLKKTNKTLEGILSEATCVINTIDLSEGLSVMFVYNLSKQVGSVKDIIEAIGTEVEKSENYII